MDEEVDKEMKKMNPSQEFIEQICELYDDVYDDREEDSAPGGLDWAPGKTAQHKSLKQFKAELDEMGIKMSNSKLLKILITGGCWSTERTREVGLLYEEYRGEGEKKAVQKIARELGISTAMVCMSLPYERPVYELEDKSKNAVRCDRWRNGDKAKTLKELREKKDSLSLWRCICAYQGEKFATSGRGSRKGIVFKYSVSKPGGAGGRKYKGEQVEGFGNEMIIEGKQKSISRSTVDLALERVLEMDGVVKGPKALNVPGAHSYLYPIFVRFGLIEKDGEE